MKLRPAIQKLIVSLVTIAFAIVPSLPGRCACSGQIVCCYAIKAEQDSGSECCCCDKKQETDSESTTCDSDSEATTCDSPCQCGASQELHGTFKKLETSLAPSLTVSRLVTLHLCASVKIPKTEFPVFTSHCQRQSILGIWLS